MEKLLEEQQKTNLLLEQLIKGKEKDEEMLTIEQVSMEFNIGICKVQKMFQDPELPVQKYTVPFKVMRKHLIEYFGQRHDYLSA